MLTKSWRWSARAIGMGHQAQTTAIAQAMAMAPDSGWPAHWHDADADQEAGTVDGFHDLQNRHQILWIWHTGIDTLDHPVVRVSQRTMDFDFCNPDACIISIIKTTASRIKHDTGSIEMSTVLFAKQRVHLANHLNARRN